VANKRSIQILKSPKDFLRLKDVGVNIGVTKWLSLSFLPNANKSLRIGWTYPNYIGSAVLRNKLKRWSREFARKNLGPDVAEGSFDVNIFLRRRNEEFYKTMSHEVFDGTLQQAFEKFKKFRDHRAPVACNSAH
jgi:ribonuclease P protein component